MNQPLTFEKAFEQLRAEITTKNRVPKLEPITWKDFFAKKAPLEIDIGCGKGKYFVSCAAVEPQLNFIGIDKAAKWMGVGKIRAEKKQLDNLVFLRGDSREFVLRLEKSSVDIFHIYFPDPWPKRRHRGRRLVSARFLTLLHNRLKEKGLIEIATDDADYYRCIQEEVGKTSHLWKTVRESSTRISRPEFRTNYELKFEAAGLKLNYMELLKV